MGVEGNPGTHFCHAWNLKWQSGQGQPFYSPRSQMEFGNEGKVHRELILRQAQDDGRGRMRPATEPVAATLAMLGRAEAAQRPEVCLEGAVEVTLFPLADLHEL